MVQVDMDLGIEVITTEVVKADREVKEASSSRTIIDLHVKFAARLGILQLCVTTVQI
ncbi:hypothetical protein Scep_006806 [Stephania cephalantha]|uniref:Uncharacterized protein n=1 Tax=Stephania cephalantha TaxID=152367 RepID=A0AAP0KA91_9MAGN